MKGKIDSSDLAHFEVGQVYELGTTLANYLLASRYAVPVSENNPNKTEDPTQRDHQERDKAADQRPRKRR